MSITFIILVTKLVICIACIIMLWSTRNDY